MSSNDVSRDVVGLIITVSTREGQETEFEKTIIRKLPKPSKVVYPLVWPEGDIEASEGTKIWPFEK